jgi:hypothetical protein
MSSGLRRTRAPEAVVEDSWVRRVWSTEPGLGERGALDREGEGESYGSGSLRISVIRSTMPRVRRLWRSWMYGIVTVEAPEQGEIGTWDWRRVKKSRGLSCKSTGCSYSRILGS